MKITNTGKVGIGTTNPAEKNYTVKEEAFMYNIPNSVDSGANNTGEGIDCNNGLGR